MPDPPVNPYADEYLPSEHVPEPNLTSAWDEGYAAGAAAVRSRLLEDDVVEAAAKQFALR